MMPLLFPSVIMFGPIDSPLFVASFYRKLQGEGLLMAFGGFGYSGKHNLAFATDRM